MARELDAKAVALVRVAIAIARGDVAALRDHYRAARHQEVPDAWIEELLLQSFLNVCYPLTLAAFGVWREVAGPLKEGGEAVDHAQVATWRTRGAESCAKVYGESYPKLLLNLRTLHPAVEPMVLVDAYGKILGRPGLDFALRELCTLAAIAALPAPRQLRAHCRGALNVGWTKEQVDLVLAVIEEQVDKERALKAWEVWAEVRG